MRDLPEKTRVDKRIPRKAFEEYLDVSPPLKMRFVSDVEQIRIANALSKETLDLSVDSAFKEIDVLTVSLKTANFDPKIFELIARQIEKATRKKVLFILKFGERTAPALFHKRLFALPWTTEPNSGVNIEGRSLDAIWENLVVWIALPEERAKYAEDLPLDERIELQDRIVKLEKQIDAKKKAQEREKQPGRKYDLHKEIVALKKELKALVGE